MHETSRDLAWLQALLDASYSSAGTHLRSIGTPERRLAAQQLSRHLTGVRVIDLATVTSKGRPRVAPVDGLFYRGVWCFGSSPESMRFRQLRRSPHVSAAHTVGEELSITVHGRAVEIDTAEVQHAGFRNYCLDVYGPSWEEFGAPAAYARIEPELMFAFAVDPSQYES